MREQQNEKNHVCGEVCTSVKMCSHGPSVTEDFIVRERNLCTEKMTFLHQELDELEEFE